MNGVGEHRVAGTGVDYHAGAVVRDGVSGSSRGAANAVAAGVTANTHAVGGVAKGGRTSGVGADTISAHQVTASASALDGDAGSVVA